jgi:hypothetical protein
LHAWCRVHPTSCSRRRNRYTVCCATARAANSTRAGHMQRAAHTIACGLLRVAPRMCRALHCVPCSGGTQALRGHSDEPPIFTRAHGNLHYGVSGTHARPMHTPDPMSAHARRLAVSQLDSATQRIAHSHLTLVDLAGAPLPNKNARIRTHTHTHTHTPFTTRAPHPHLSSVAQRARGSARCGCAIGVGAGLVHWRTAVGFRQAASS